MKTSKANVLIIGSGVGGICSAARLIKKGLKVTIVEQLPYLGGRCSTREYKGHKTTTGGIILPLGGGSTFQEAFDMLGAEFNMRPIGGKDKGGTLYRLPDRTYEMTPKNGLRGLLQFCLNDDEAGNELYSHFKRALHWSEPLYNITFSEWLSQYSHNTDLHEIFQGHVGGFVGVNIDECPAGEFFRNLKLSARTYGFGTAVNGNIDLMNSLAAAIKNKGGRISTETSCKQILVENGIVKGAIVEKDGEEETINADFVISNAGPDLTVELAGTENFEKSYMTLLTEHNFKTPVVHISMSTDEPIEDFPGIVTFGHTRRLVFLETPSVTCPELVPEGKHITTTYSVPKLSAGPLKLPETIEMVMLDLRDFYPNFQEAELFHIATHHSGWPAMRRWPGYPMPTRTPVVNLYNVGDGCQPLGYVGIEACAITARDVSNEIAPD
ncbi:MAG: NAD(P)/FAD-dependent oxidoreductase [Desulfobacterales bacterium]|jgi:phytoene desaturase|nr:NAD(P)/FAD-dependent oxidoreductase [Desulfobacteraceae bacterium]MBT7084862.1 NAD(P)/FAD-dependent oxidoreductase [Desulfobacterales bacterium]MBT7698261.1 NAD(P)/FAD-dependent oxidoreductase [Desulfobacterales bacterium]